MRDPQDIVLIARLQEQLAEQDARGLRLAVEVERLAEIVERIMTDHWDLAACPCWVCVAGRGLGLGPRQEYLKHGRPPAANFPPVREHIEEVIAEANSPR